MQWVRLLLVVIFSIPAFVNANVLGTHCASIERFNHYQGCVEPFDKARVYLQLATWPLINGRKIF